MGGVNQVDSSALAPSATTAGPRRAPSIDAAPLAAGAPAPAATPTASAQAKAADEVRQMLQERFSGKDVRLRFEERIDAFVIQIEDPSSKTVVFQVPPEEIIRLRERLQEYTAREGILVDDVS